MAGVSVRALIGAWNPLVLGDVYGQPGVSHEYRGDVPVAQPPRARGCVGGCNIHGVLYIDGADSPVGPAKRNVRRVLCVCRSVGSGEVIDGATVIETLGKRVVGGKGEMLVESAAKRGLQGIVA